ncbi:MAG: asparagine synthase (glutamine-hydrolyzing) [bacterium]
MCGIFGIVTDKKINREVVEKATRLMKHRGPDDFGVTILKNGAVNVGLGHQRLSILDLSKAGHQPMCNEDESIYIVYNGEIYNFCELRRNLESKGHIFKSKTDTEVIIHAYEEWGVDCLSKFTGMFAFGIWDKKHQRLFIARDRLGIKPLYYTQCRNGFLFASEIKALLGYPGIKKDVNFSGIYSSLMLLWCPHPETVFKNINKLSPGHYIILKEGRLAIRKYWNLRISEDDKCDDKYSNRLFELLHQNVKMEMISDVPLGSFLSGGLDSSSIVALMSDVKKEKISTYTIAYAAEDRKFEAMSDDSKYANIIARLYNTDHSEFVIEPNILELFPKMIWHLDEPIADPAAMNTYLICKSAKEKGTTVLLSGIGADEIFGGYRKYISARVAQYYRLLTPELRNKFISGILSRFPVATRSSGLKLIRWAKWFNKKAMTDPFSCYINNTSYYNGDELNDLIAPEHIMDYRTSYPIMRFINSLTKISDCHYVNQMGYVDTTFYLPDLNLTYADKASMAASVEVRLPIIDHKIVEFAFQLPAREKINNFTQKKVLKDAMRKILPKEVINRPKAPFGAPLRSWIARDLNSLIDDLLSERQIRKRGFLNYQYVRKLVDDNKYGREDNAHRLWGLLTLELWFQTFIDNDGSMPISL